MQLHISPSLRHVTVFPGKEVREFIKVKVGSRRLSYRMLFYSILFFTFILRFVFVMTAVDTIDGETRCSTIGCLGKKLGPRILGRRLESSVPEVVYQVLEEPIGKDELQGRSDIPQSLDEFMTEIKDSNIDARTFAVKLREMVTLLEERTRNAKIQEYLYRHVASSSIPKQLHCLALRLANEHSTNAAARLQLPSAEFVPALVDNSFFHFVLASDNVLAASVVATSLVQNSLRPHKVVLHIITDRKTYCPMQAWFSLHPLSPAIIEVKALHHFDWFSKGKVPVLEAMEKDQKVRSQFRGGSSAIVANNTDKPNVIAAKLQALSPKYNSIMNHIRIHLPEMFPSLNKVVFLDDDVVVQTDLSPLWDIDMNGKVNGAVETCRGKDKFVMSKKFKSYLNFSHPLVSNNFDPNTCAWAYGMNIFDLEAWRKTNISRTYHYWIEQNLKSDLSLWQLGTLPPGLIAFHGHVHVIDPFWHMLGFGYQENISSADAKSAGVIHFNGRAKPWLEIAFPNLRPLWAKYIDFSDKFIKGCHIRAS
ncbi:putative polygalacturonate 4-alpha-galacturonosyltransferase [Rosa chinensis]|uniref:Hexosyltransferase n=1 Tax=Rosa chinensis TaxID=74649 RepID=A0A2P6QBP1_ROSCH|nr:probable galacturonosyltransferase 12 [Rosa chinensis]PRQ31596.1 putative polygalacturonate 4-alpha-galacturonosyltransferase [Rosa chinensis]